MSVQILCTFIVTSNIMVSESPIKKQCENAISRDTDHKPSMFERISEAKKVTTTEQLPISHQRPLHLTKYEMRKDEIALEVRRLSFFR